MSYNFTSTNTSSSTNQTKNDSVVIDVTFGKIMEDIGHTWKKLNEKQNMISQDIQHLERMFNMYTTNPVFYQAKEVLESEKTANRQKLQTLEEQVYLVKRNYGSIGNI